MNHLLIVSLTVFLLSLVTYAIFVVAVAMLIQLCFCFYCVVLASIVSHGYAYLLCGFQVAIKENY